MPLRIALVGLVLVTGCGREFCKRRMEIVPGLIWEYYAPLLEQYHSPRHSRIVSDKHGVIVEGGVNEVWFNFHEYGFSINGRGESEMGKCVYVDLLRNVIDEREATLIALTGGKGKSFGGVLDAPSAMGLYTEEPRRHFRTAMEALKKRVEAKLKQDGLRRL